MHGFTVTLPDGRPAVVHTDYVAVGYPLTDQGRADLADAARDNFGVLTASPAAHCPTVRTVAPDVVTTSEADGWTWAYANVLCTQPRCRQEAEQREEEAEREHPAAARLQEWATGQHAAA